MVVKQLAGETVEIRGIIPPDVDPHNYEPSPRDMGTACSCCCLDSGGEKSLSTYFKIDSGRPPRILKSLILPEITKTLKSSCCHHHHAHCDQSVDTHYWMDPLTVVDQATPLSPESLLKPFPNIKIFMKRI